MHSGHDREDELSNLKLVVHEDKKVIAPARWMPRVELACRDKRCWLLGGHCTTANSIMVWCKCSAPDRTHPDSSRLMALDAWVVEHCMGESLDAYDVKKADDDDEEEEEEEEGDQDKKDNPLDRLCLEETVVVRVGPNVLTKQISLQQLLCYTLVAQGGSKGLKGVSFWVYWYDQPLPAPPSPGRRRTWVKGELTNPGLGVWYLAKVLGCDASKGTIRVRYEEDGTEDSLYLLVAFTHFDPKPPPRGSRPRVLPDMDMVQYLGLPPSAAQEAAKSKGPRPIPMPASKATATAKDGTKRRTLVPEPVGIGEYEDDFGGREEPQAQRKATATAQPPPAAPPVAWGKIPARRTAGGGGGGGAGNIGEKAAPSSKAAAGKKQQQRAAAAVRSNKTVPSVKSEDNVAAKQQQKQPPPPHPASQQPVKVPVATAVATITLRENYQAETKLPQKRPFQSSPPPAQPTAAGAAAGAYCGASLRRLGSGASGGGGGGGRPGGGDGGGQEAGVRPAKRDRRCHEFESVPLASSAPPAAGGLLQLPGPLAPGSWCQLEEGAKRRPGYRGLMCGRMEQFPVFVFNELDDALVPAPSEYLTLATFEERLPRALVTAGREQPAVAVVAAELKALCAAAQPPWGTPCGRSYHEAVRKREKEQLAATAAGGVGGARGGGGGAVGEGAPEPTPAASYGSDGRLLATRPLGVHECSSSCSAPACQANIRLSRGLPRPMEVFRTPDRSWGVRCPQALAPGDFVAPLLGSLVAGQTVAEVEMAGAGGGRSPGGGSGVPPGVVLLDHFYGLWETVFTRGLNWCERNLKLWQLPPNPLTHGLQCAITATHTPSCGAAAAASDDDSPARPACRRLSGMLALDMRAAGNVGRFVRQWRPEGGGGGSISTSAGPSLVVQPVLAGACRSPQLYYVGLFAARRVEAGEELTCDFAGVGAAMGIH